MTGKAINTFMRAKLGELVKVKNHNKHVNARTEYFHVFVQEGEEVISLLLTGKDLKGLVNRAKKNPEDIPTLTKAGFFKRLFGGC